MTETLTPTSFAGLRVEKPQERQATINALVYGDSATGKTTLTAGADAVPEMRKVVLIDIEKGDLSLRKTTYRPDVVRISTWKELQDLYHALLAGGHGYQTAIVDSLNEANDLSIKQVMLDDGLTESATPEWKHWNMNQVRMLRMLRNFRDLDLNVLFTSLVSERTDKLTGKTKKLPDLPGKLAAKVPAIFDNVFYYYTKEVEGVPTRCLLTIKTEDTVAKNRGSDLLPPVLVIPHTDEAVAMQTIYDGILGRTSK